MRCGILDIDSEVGGAALETLVMGHLMACRDLLKMKYEISFWHTKNHIEVDFILYGQRGFFAIEVKSSKTIREKDVEGLFEFQKDYPKAKIILLYGGSTKKQGDLYAVNVEEFLINPSQYI